MEENTKPKQFVFAQPLPASSLFHVFESGTDRSLCGNYGLLFTVKGGRTIVSGEEEWKKGQDCKACFRKAGLLPDKEDN